MNTARVEQSAGSKRLLLAVLACVFALQIHSWNTLEGYQLADSVEYMERARNLAIGQEVRVDGAVRSFGFSLLLTPIFWVASLFGAESWHGLAWIVRLLQMGLGLGLVIASARLAERVTGRPIGWAAAALVGANPVFLQYTVSPVSGVAAGLFIALALLAQQGVETMLDDESGEALYQRADDTLGQVRGGIDLLDARPAVNVAD